jgi:hypothetical protein
MNSRLVIISTSFIIILLVTFLFVFELPSGATNKYTADVYVGIDVAYADMETITNLIDEISSYTNLFIVGCTAITQNETQLNNICQYLYDKDMSFIIYQNTPIQYQTFTYNNSRQSDRISPYNQTAPRNSSSPFNRSPNWTIPQQSSNFAASSVSNWTETAKNKWGAKFLGIYYCDEPAGRQLDLDPDWTIVKSANNYTDATNQFVKAENNSVYWFKNSYSNWTNVSLFTSDYALYQFDYESGYDVVLAQLGWNLSRQLNIALCRGAATLQNKDWGVIVTWEYTESPYLESGSKLYEDLVLAYNNGAKYISVFDSNEAYNQSTLSQDHLSALKQFWQYIQDNPRSASSARDRVAFVLPEDYGYGFRGPTDSIWGLWTADSLSYNLCVSVDNKLAEYETKLDIVYNTTQVQTSGYKALFYIDK